MRLLETRTSKPEEERTPVDLKGNPKVRELQTCMASVIRGKEEVIESFLVAVLAGGAILLEDLPGVGKTTLAKTFARLVELEFSRLQCTSDLLPADVFGFSVYSPQDGSFRFRPGPIFCNVLLVDEINRASPRTQSALLEAMAERQVTMEGECRKLDEPFLVIATQNPSGFQGTYPLPEAQLDRFLFHLALDYPDHASEVDLLYDQDGVSQDRLVPLMNGDELKRLQDEVKQVEVHRDVADYIVRIVSATRTDERVVTGCSPRGAQMIFRAAQSLAFVKGRNYALPDDVQCVAPLALAHRIVTRSKDRACHRDKRQLVEAFVQSTPVPA